MITNEMKNKTGKIISINVSKIKGTAKLSVESAMLLEDKGVEGDAHCGIDEIKQISLLAIESIEKQKICIKIKKPDVLLKPGDFAENITTQGLNLSALKIGDRLKAGNGVLLEISKIGKECHKYCAIYYKTGDCIMPREGIFAKVIKGGKINRGDRITL